MKFRMHNKKQKRQLPIASALLPSLVASEIASVQALERRQGSYFTLDVKYGDSKGSVTAGDTMMAALTGHSRTMGGRTYASTLVRDEAVTLSGITTGTYSLAYGDGLDVSSARATYSVLRDSDGNVIATDATTAGTFVAESGYTITASITDGVLTVGAITGITLSSSEKLYISYVYIYDKIADAYGNKTGVPTAYIDMASHAITAIDFPIKSIFSLGAAIDLQKAQNLYERLGFSKRAQFGGHPCLN